MQKIDLTQGKVMKVLTALALPIMGGSLLQFAYNIVDMFWVGKLGTNAVASIGSSSFFIGLGYAVNAMVVVGTGIKVAHAAGRQDELEAKAYMNAGILINGILGLCYSVLLILGGKYFIDFLQLGNVEVERDAYLYLACSGPVLFFAFFNLLYTRIFGSYGNNKSAFKISAIGIIVNIILDPIFIYTFKWGVFGAAFATLIANVIMFILFLGKAWELIRFDGKIGIKTKKVTEIIVLGFPMSFQRVLFTLVNIVLARLIGAFGPEAIAAQKLGVQIEAITFMVIGGLNGAVASFTGQNYGANQQKRVQEGYKMALGIGGIYALFTTILFIWIPELIVSIFISDLGTIGVAANYLRIIGLSQIFSTVEMVTNGLFTGIGMPKIPANISIIFTILRIPMALILTPYLGINGIWWSIALSSVLKGLVAYRVYRIKVWKRYTNVERN